MLSHLLYLYVDLVRPGVEGQDSEHVAPHVVLWILLSIVVEVLVEHLHQVEVSQDHVHNVREEHSPEQPLIYLFPELEDERCDEIWLQYLQVIGLNDELNELDKAWPVGKEPSQIHHLHFHGLLILAFFDSIFFLQLEQDFAALLPIDDTTLLSEGHDFLIDDPGHILD